MAVRKIWRCHYIGTHDKAPKVIDVPSENTTGMPTGKEIVEALKKMGYDDGIAHSIASGGSNLCWKCEDSGLKPQPENENDESIQQEDKKGNLFGFALGTMSMLGQERAKGRAKSKSKEGKSSKTGGFFGFGKKKETETPKKKSGLFGFGKKKKKEKSSSKSTSLFGGKSSSSSSKKSSGGSLFGKAMKSASKGSAKRKR